MIEEKILLAHGTGGKLSHDLIQKVFLEAFFNEILEPLDDSAKLPNQKGTLAFTTDSYVVHPIFFPGGDIGRLAVFGTVNDLSMMGAIPSFLSLGIIIEEGFPMELLRKITLSIKEATEFTKVKIVTGDTKVVERRGEDQIFINTAGIGWIRPGINLSGSNARPGDKILINGPIGDHEMAILSQREGFGFHETIKSDLAPLHDLVGKMLDVCPRIRCMRDPTRGGLATTLNEIALKSKVGIWLDEKKIPIRDPVRGICELLGLDPLYLANEGKLIAICPSEDAERVLEVMKEHPYGKESEIIGMVTEEYPQKVILRTLIGGHRIMDMLTGSQFPRIC